MNVYDEELSSERESEGHETNEKAVEMAQQLLSNVQSNVAALLEQCSCSCGAKRISEPWVQSKITLANDYLDTVHAYVVNSQAGQKESGDVGFVVAVEEAMTTNGSRNP